MLDQDREMEMLGFITNDSNDSGDDVITSGIIPKETLEKLRLEVLRLYQQPGEYIQILQGGTRYIPNDIARDATLSIEEDFDRELYIRKHNKWIISIYRRIFRIAIGLLRRII